MKILLYIGFFGLSGTVWVSAMQVSLNDKPDILKNLPADEVYTSCNKAYSESDASQGLTSQAALFYEYLQQQQLELERKKDDISLVLSASDSLLSDGPTLAHEVDPFIGWDYNSETDCVWIGYKKVTQKRYHISALITDEKFDIVKKMPILEILYSAQVSNQKSVFTQKNCPLCPKNVIDTMLVCFTEHKNRVINCFSSKKKMQSFIAKFLPELSTPLKSMNDLKNSTPQKNDDSHGRSEKNGTILDDLESIVAQYKNRYKNSIQDLLIELVA